jgi:hypothetical protein
VIAHVLSTMVVSAWLMGHVQPEAVPAPSPPAASQPSVPPAPAPAQAAASVPAQAAASVPAPSVQAAASVPAPSVQAAASVPAPPPGQAPAPASTPVGASPPAPPPGPAAPAGAAPLDAGYSSNYPVPPDMVHPPAAAPERPTRFVFAYLPSVTLGLGAWPSLNHAFFFGGRLRDRRWAVGFQLTASIGLAERYVTGLFTHRYHVTALTSFGARGRGFASFGGGAAVRIYQPMVELEGRVGYRFGAKRRGIVGAIARLGYDFYHREGAPVPQFGVMIGVSSF